MAFGAEWVIRRFVPDPTLVGVVRIRFQVGQPFAERRADLLSHLARMEDVVVLWDSPGTIFSVAFERSHLDGHGPVDEEVGWARRWVIEPSLLDGGALAYFDFEGAWSRWALGEAPRAYPRGLTTVPSESRLSRPNLRAKDLVELVERPFSKSKAKAGGFWPFGGDLPRHLRNLVDRGLALPLTIPDLARIPGPERQALTSVVFASGIWASDCAGQQLFRELGSRCRATPFLYVFDTNRVLLGFLAPAPSTLAKGRTPIASVLGEFLREIEVIREPVGSVSTVVNHRYDRLFSAVPA
jgi:hypothetical protein